MFALGKIALRFSASSGYFPPCQAGTWCPRSEASPCSLCRRISHSNAYFQPAMPTPSPIEGVTTLAPDATLLMERLRFSLMRQQGSPTCILSFMVLLSAGCSVLSSDDTGVDLRTDVFVGGVDGYHTYRIPALIVTSRVFCRCDCHRILPCRQGRRRGTANLSTSPSLRRGNARSSAGPWFDYRMVLHFIQA